MIVFDLRCGGGHVFEAWFASSAGYEEQREAGQIECPVCHTGDVQKAVMAPSVASKSNRSEPADPRLVKQTLELLAKQQAKLIASSEWVGTAFVDRARAMQAGKEAQASIHGQASLADAKALIDDGVPVAPLIFPVIPPDSIN